MCVCVSQVLVGPAHPFRQVLLDVLLVLLGSDAKQVDGLAGLVCIGCIQGIFDSCPETALV